MLLMFISCNKYHVEHGCINSASSLLLNTTFLLAGSLFQSLQIKIYWLYFKIIREITLNVRHKICAPFDSAIYFVIRFGLFVGHWKYEYILFQLHYKHDQESATQ